MVASGPDKTVLSGTGTVLTLGWDAAQLADATGAAVELRVVGTASGGGKKDKRTVEVGAAAWDSTAMWPDG